MMNLENASLADLEELIDVLDRPWARADNDRLRARFHEARRNASRKRDLAAAIAETICRLSPQDHRWIMDRLSRKGECSRLVGECFSRPPSVVGDLVASVWSEVAEEVVSRLFHLPTRRRRRHGR